MLSKTIDTFHMVHELMENIMESVCQFNKFGFCKFIKSCFRKHEERKCENGTCEKQECPFRHPRTCKFFVMYKNCKFGTYCKFEHDLPKDENNKEIESIKKELEELKERIIEKEKEIKHKDGEAAELTKNIEMKLNYHEHGQMRG